MQMEENVFDWKNVPKALIVLAGILTALTLWGLFDISIYGNSVVILPMLIIATVAFWLLVYWTGTKKTRVSAAEEPVTLPPQRPEQAPFFQEYMAEEQWFEEHPNAIPAAMPPQKGSHKYDARV